MPDLLADLVRLKVDAIVTAGTPGALAAKRATKTIPIVMAVAGDAVGTKLGCQSGSPRWERHRLDHDCPGTGVSISGTGIGIAAEDQEKVFEEFRQVGTADKKAEGTGLGLTLCRKFVELHGGRIWVRSVVSQGSTFTFSIPARGGE